MQLPLLSKLRYLVTGKSALRDFMVRAEGGDALAQHLLAGIYYSKKDVPAEMEQAIYWWRKSAEQGFADAQFNLALMYYQGCGVQQDATEALRWLGFAAEQGKPEAQFLLATHYIEGSDMESNIQLAAWWLSLAAEQGYRDAQFKLGVMYVEGRFDPDGVALAENLSRAFFWLDLAHRSGSADAAKTRDILITHMTAEAVAEGQRLTEEWAPKTRAQSALKIYRANVEGFFRELDSGPKKAPVTKCVELIDRTDDLLDIGASLGAEANDTVNALRELRHTLAEELKNAAPDTKDSADRINSLRELLRAPALRPWLKRPK